MNSSGTKRGLAVAAVSALAVAGIPALATSANAATGDTLTVVSAGPALNGGNVGAVVVLKTSGRTVTTRTISLSRHCLAGRRSQDTQTRRDRRRHRRQDARDPDRRLNNITLHIKATTPTPVTTAAFRVIDNDGVVACRTGGQRGARRGLALHHRSACLGQGDARLPDGRAGSAERRVHRDRAGRRRAHDAARHEPDHCGHVLTTPLSPRPTRRSPRPSIATGTYNCPPPRPTPPPSATT